MSERLFYGTEIFTLLEHFISRNKNTPGHHYINPFTIALLDTSNKLNLVHVTNSNVTNIQKLIQQIQSHTSRTSETSPIKLMPLAK